MSETNTKYLRMKKKYNFRDSCPTCIKCVLVGDAGVGKTSLAARMSSRKFKSDYVPTVFDNYATTVILDDKPFHFSIFDTAGKEDYDRVRVISYMKCDVFLVCFASDRRETLASVESHWIPEIRQYLPKVPYILVSTQIDKREDSYESINTRPCVTFKEATEVARTCGAASYLECSALTEEGIADVIRETIETVHKSMDCRHRKVACCSCSIV